jgi:methionyl-tRNA formyltransferase
LFTGYSYIIHDELPYNFPPGEAHSKVIGSSLKPPLKILFMGTSDFAVPALKALHGAGYPLTLVVTQPDRPAGRGLELKASPVKKTAVELGLEVFQPEKIKFPESVEMLKSHPPDVTVVAAYGQILPLSVLRVPKVTNLNIHGSILPKYRGAAPIHYAVMAGETETGVTIMYMGEKLDDGDMLLVKKTPIGPDECTGDVHDRLAILGAEGIVEALALLAENKAPRIPQDHSLATFSPSIKREKCRVQWEKSAPEVVNQIRGLAPWPVAETQWGEMPLRLFSAKALDGTVSTTPGEVLAVGKEGVEVASGKGRVLLKEIQPPGKKRMGAFEFTLGHPNFKPGERLK